MAYTPDLSNEYLWWSGTEQVTLTFRDHLDATIGGAALTDRTVRRHSVDDRPEEFSRVTAAQGQAFWAIPNATAVVSTNVPAKGMLITDSDSVVWVVDSVKERRRGGALASWICSAFRRRTT